MTMTGSALPEIAPSVHPDSTGCDNMAENAAEIELYVAACKQPEVVRQLLR
jgi:hypothetical protein